MNTAQDVRDITCLFRSNSSVQTELAKFKGLLIKIKVIKGFSAKLKVLKDCNQIKGSTRFACINYLNLSN